MAKNGRKKYGEKADYLLRSRFLSHESGGYFNEYPWWVAHYYQRRPDNDGMAWRFWQHSDRGQVDGINGPVDFNVFNGTVEELQGFVDGIKETP
ncbi:GH25 family lysozyme [Escherichia coli]|uniref:GH25 family lysozyme n=1 Tax=Escherichia coli TaxID=562 RepID=UPI003B5207DE